MAKPQQPELSRSGNTPLDPDSIASEIAAHRRPTDGDKRTAPVPEENRPGHRPERDQDQPEPEEVARRLGVHGDPQPDAPEHAPDVSPWRRALELGAGTSLVAVRTGRSLVRGALDRVRRR